MKGSACPDSWGTQLIPSTNLDVQKRQTEHSVLQWFKFFKKWGAWYQWRTTGLWDERVAKGPGKASQVINGTTRGSYPSLLLANVLSKCYVPSDFFFSLWYFPKQGQQSLSLLPDCLLTAQTTLIETQLIWLHWNYSCFLKKPYDLDWQIYQVFLSGVRKPNQGHKDFHLFFTWELQGFAFHTWVIVWSGVNFCCVALSKGSMCISDLMFNFLSTIC